MVGKKRGRKPRKERWEECPKLDDDGKFTCGSQKLACPKGCGQCTRHCNCMFKKEPDKDRTPLCNISNQEPRHDLSQLVSSVSELKGEVNSNYSNLKRNRKASVAVEWLWTLCILTHFPNSSHLVVVCTD
jgi:hypothetical protein